MRIMVLACAAAVAAAACAGDAAPPAVADRIAAEWSARKDVPRERIEWVQSWIEDAETNVSRRVLVIGDSIVGNYFSTVSRMLAGKASCMRLNGSRCVGDPVLLMEAKTALSLYKFDVIHVNNGLHGMGLPDEDYARFLPQYLDYIHALQPQAKLIWGRTTDVHPQNYKGYAAKHARILARNAAADAVVKARGIHATDLFAISTAHPEYHVKDGCHFNADGAKALGEAVAASILLELDGALGIGKDDRGGGQGAGRPTRR